MSDSCGHSCASDMRVVDARYRRVLIAALLVNLAMFIVEVMAGSAAVQIVRAAWHELVEERVPS